ncbi:hypothetical protein AAH126_14700 [Bacteroides uniformis]
MGCTTVAGCRDCLLEDGCGIYFAVYYQKERHKEPLIKSSSLCFIA